MPPEESQVQSPAAVPGGDSDVATVESAFAKAIDGGGLNKDPSTGRFVSPKKATAAPAKAEAAPATTESTAAPAQGDGAAPSTETPSGEPAEQQTKAEPDATEAPLIEPPASWSKDASDKFRALPREAQEIIAQRERERDVELRRGQNESADTRKAVEAERDALKQERQQLARQATLYVSDLEKKFLADWKDVKSLEELDEVSYVQMQKQLQTIQLYRNERDSLTARVAKQAEKELADFRAAEDKAFREEQGLTDDAKWQASKAEMSAYAKQAGITDEEVAGASRAHLSVLKDAMAYRKSVKAMEQAKAAGQTTTAAPAKVQQPGTARSATGKDDQAAALMKQLRETGSTESAESAFAHALLRGNKGGSGQRHV